MFYWCFNYSLRARWWAMTSCRIFLITIQLRLNQVEVNILLAILTRLTQNSRLTHTLFHHWERWKSGPLVSYIQLVDQGQLTYSNPYKFHLKLRGKTHKYRIADVNYGRVTKCTFHPLINNRQASRIHFIPINNRRSYSPMTSKY